MTLPITKTISKKFASFEKEEQWLNELAECGWRLIDYGRDGFEALHYTFEVDLEARNMRYKIDFRTLKDEAEFDDYKELFSEADWTLIAKDHHYSKYIFISNSAKDIFSDTNSLIERELRRRNFSWIYVITFSSISVIMLILYAVFRYDWLMTSTILSAGTALYFGFWIWKGHRAIQQLKQGGK